MGVQRDRHDPSDHGDAQRDGRPVPRLTVGTTPLVDVVRWARAALSGSGGFELDVLDPDAVDHDAVGHDGVGTSASAATAEGAQRSWRAWVDLAEVLACRCHTPERIGPSLVRVRYSPLPPEATWHGGAGRRERYEPGGAFASVTKLEHPGFLVPLLEALERVRPPDGGRVLVLGCHRGDEIAALGWLEPPPADLKVTGVDRATGALDQARSRFPDARFVEADVNALPDVGRFDLAIAIGLLQSPGVDDKALLRRIVQRHLEERSALLVGLPNGRFRGREAVWGARTKNYRAADLSLVVRDLAAYRRYLQQHGFTTHVGGRYDLLLGAWRRG